MSEAQTQVQDQARANRHKITNMTEENIDITGKLAEQWSPEAERKGHCDVALPVGVRPGTGNSRRRASVQVVFAFAEEQG